MYLFIFRNHNRLNIAQNILKHETKSKPMIFIELHTYLNNTYRINKNTLYLEAVLE